MSLCSRRSSARPASCRRLRASRRARAGSPARLAGWGWAGRAGAELGLPCPRATRAGARGNGSSDERLAGSGAERLVERRVYELVGALVVLAPDGPHGPGVELAQRPHRVEEERPQTGVLDLVLAADLARHELRVVDHLDLVGAQLARELEP